MAKIMILCGRVSNPAQMAALVRSVTLALEVRVHDLPGSVSGFWLMGKDGLPCTRKKKVSGFVHHLHQNTLSPNPEIVACTPSGTR